MSKPAELAIDADGHVLEPDDLWVREMPPSLRERAPRRAGSSRHVLVDQELVPPRRTFANLEHRYQLMTDDERVHNFADEGFTPRSLLDALDVEGVTASVLFPSRGLVVVGAAGAGNDVVNAAARVYNDWIADFCRAAPARLFAAGMINPRDVPAAVDEARRCVGELGCLAVFLRPNPVEGRNWHDPAYEPLWSVIEELGVPVCFHEGASVTLPQVATDRYDDHAFWHACTHPMEQQMAMLSLVVGGVAERHPTLRFAHLESGAGWLPYWAWRLDETIEAEHRAFPELTMKPSEYVQRQFFVSIDTDEAPGIAAIDLFRDPHVTWGSDYPHGDGKFPNALKTLAAIPGMTPTRFRSVVGDAPLRLFGRPLTDAVGRQT